MQAPAYFSAPFAFAAHTAFGPSDPPPPFTPIGPPSPFSAGYYSPHYGQDPRSLVQSSSRAVTRTRATTTIHTHHHFTSHHVHVSRVKQSKHQQKANSKPHESRPQPTPLQHPASQTPQTSKHSHSRFSKCTGKKKALCIGINYKGQSNELHGCVNDAKNVKRFLISMLHRSGR